MKRLLIYTCMAMAMLVADVAITKNCELKAQSLPLGLRFEPMIVDFGSIAEDGGSVVRSVNVTNVSNEAITISEMVSTCGCTTIDFRPCTLAPHESIDFAVRYDPMNRPGRIDRSIYIIVEGQDEEIRLRLTGYVLERERTIEELYPFDMGGGLRLKSNFHAFGYLEHGKAMTEHIGYVNTSTKPITVEVVAGSSSGLMTLAMPKRIEAGASGDIEIHYSVAEDHPYYGTAKDILRIKVNGVEAYYTLSTQVIVVDNFDNMDDISAPKLVISKNIIKFGDVNSLNEVLEQRVTLTNEGGTPLVVRAMESNTKAVECIAERNMTIKAGESREVIVRLRAAYIEDVDNPLVARICIITNDPMRPMQTIKANAIPR